MTGQVLDVRLYPSSSQLVSVGGVARRPTMAAPFSSRFRPHWTHHWTERWVKDPLCAGLALTMIALAGLGIVDAAVRAIW